MQLWKGAHRGNKESFGHLFEHQAATRRGEVEKSAIAEYALYTPMKATVW